MPSDERAAKLSNTLQLLFNAIVLGIAADSLLDHPDAPRWLRTKLIELPHHTLDLAQVADALADPHAEEQTRNEFRKLLFRGAVTNAFRMTSDYFGRVLTDTERSAAPWYWLAKILGNALSHNLTVSVRESDIRKHLPVTWGAITITASDHGKSIDDIINFSSALDLLFQLRSEVAKRAGV